MYGHIGTCNISPAEVRARIGGRDARTGRGERGTGSLAVLRILYARPWQYSKPQIWSVQDDWKFRVEGRKVDRNTRFRVIDRRVTKGIKLKKKPYLDTTWWLSWIENDENRMMILTILSTLELCFLFKWNTSEASGDSRTLSHCVYTEISWMCLNLDNARVCDFSCTIQNIL